MFKILKDIFPNFLRNTAIIFTKWEDTESKSREHSIAFNNIL